MADIKDNKDNSTIVKDSLKKSDGTEITLTDMNNQQVPVSSIWQNGKGINTIILFVRHFM
jgi:hypothetical protein